MVKNLLLSEWDLIYRTRYGCSKVQTITRQLRFMQYLYGVLNLFPEMCLEILEDYLAMSTTKVFIQGVG